MIRAKNLTPFAFGYAPCLREPGHPEMTVAVRARFVLKPGQALVPVSDTLTDLDVEHDFVPEELKEKLETIGTMMAQGPIQSDLYEEDDARLQGALLYPSDLAELKLNAEVMFKGSCHPPEGHPTKQCEVVFEVNDWSKRLLVTGHRQWVDRLAGGKATDPIPFDSMPIDWAHAYGGPDCELNPVGCGHPLDKPLEQRQDELLDLPLSIQSAFAMHERLPNIEAPAAPVHRASQHPIPAGFGPISPMWPQRRNKLGKNYDENYRENREPYRPEDFDWTHHHAAPEDQQLDGYLHGGEHIRLVNLHPEAAELRAQLPQLRLRVFVADKTEQVAEVPLVIDTLFADTDAEELTLVWRGRHAVAEDDISDVTAILVAAEQQDEPPRDREVYLQQLRDFVNDPAGLNDTLVPALKQLDDDIESGQLERDIDAIPEDDQMLANIIDRVSGPLLDEEQLQPLREVGLTTVIEARKNNPDSLKKMKEEVKKSLREAKDPPVAPVLPMKDGKPTVVAALAQNLAAVAQSQKDTPGVDFTDANDLIDEAVSRINDPGVQARREQLKMAAIAEQPSIEPGPRLDLAYQDYSDRDLSGADLSEANLEGATFNRAKLVGAKLDGACLLGASISKADLSGASLKDTTLDQAFFSGTKGHGTDFSGASLANTIVMRCDLHQARFRGAQGSFVQFHNTKLSGAELTDANFNFATFNECDLRQALFERATLVHSLIRECQAQGAAFDEAQLDKAGIVMSDLSGASFLAAKCNATSWFKSTLRKVNFAHAILRENLMIWAPASEANFYAADLTKARLYKANLRDACFDKAKLLEADLRKTVLASCAFRDAVMYESHLTEAVGNDVDFRGAMTKKMHVTRAQMTRKG